MSALTKSKERPILFSAPMVLALLSGRKTQTRRIVKPSPGLQSKWLTSEKIHRFVESGEMNGDGWQMWHPRGGPRSPYGWIRSPYGGPGDTLWVKETIDRGVDENGGPIERVSSFYAADGARTKADAWPWQRTVLPSIHCPRGLSRITLEVAAVRVERLQAISEADAKAEGVGHFSEVYDRVGTDQRLTTGEHCVDVPYRASFAVLWDDINGERCLWKSNPWVWVVEFKRVEVTRG